jgi:hypothetical protein
MLKYNQKVKTPKGVGIVFARKSEMIDEINTPTDYYYVDIQEKDNRDFKANFPGEKTKGVLVVFHESELMVV